MAKDDGPVEFLESDDVPAPDLEPAAGPRRRWLVGLAAAAAAGAVVAALVSTGNSGRPAGSPRTAHPTAAGPSELRLAQQERPVVVKHLGRRLLPAPTDEDVFARGREFVVRIEPSTGTVTRTLVPDLGTGGGVSFLPAGSRVLIRPADHVLGYAVPDGQPARVPRGLLALNGPAWPGPKPGQAWVDADDRIVLVDERGRRLGPHLPVPFGATALGGLADGRGDLLFRTRDGWYAASPNRLDRVATGDMIAIGRSRLLVSHCPFGRCEQVVIDRSTGRGASLFGQYSGLTGLPGVIAPDGSVAAYADFPTSLLELTDLRSGNALLLPVECTVDSQSMAWSADSRQLFVIDTRGALLAVDPRSGHVVDLSRLTGGPVAQVAVRTPAA